VLFINNAHRVYVTYKAAIYRTMVNILHVAQGLCRSKQKTRNTDSAAIVTTLAHMWHDVDSKILYFYYLDNLLMTSL
jgi:hypothetical protein